MEYKGLARLEKYVLISTAQEGDLSLQNYIVYFNIARWEIGMMINICHHSTQQARIGKWLGIKPT